MSVNKLLKTLSVFFILFVMTCCAVANPFTSKSEKDRISPVRRSIAASDMVEKQMDLRNRLAEYIKGRDGESFFSVLFTILITSFLYGIFHAAGPGHRKTIVFSLYLARRAPPWEPALAGLLLAFFHGGTSVVLLLVLQQAAGLISAQADKASLYMEGAAYSILLVATIFLLLYGIRNFIKGSYRETTGHDNEKKHLSLGVLLLTGFYPCPGAVLILILSLTQDKLGMGIAAVMFMSAGMALPVIAAGYFAWFGRTGLFTRFRKNEHKIEKISSIVEIAGYSVLLIVTLYIAQPFIVSMFREW